MFFINFIKFVAPKIQAKDCLYIGAIIILTVFLMKGRKKDSYYELQKPTIDSVKYHTDKQGNLHSVIEEKKYSKQDFNTLTDSIKKTLKVTKVIYVDHIVNKIDTQFYPDYFTLDSLDDSIKVSHEDPYSKISFLGDFKTKQGEFKLELINDTVTLLNAYKKHLFKKDEYFTDITHSNKLITTVEGNSYSAKVPKPVLDFDIFLGYDPFIKKTIIAVGVGLHIFTLKSR